MSSETVELLEPCLQKTLHLEQPSNLFLIKTVFIKLVKLKNTPIRFEVLAQRDSSAPQLTRSGSVMACGFVFTQQCIGVSDYGSM